MKTYIRKCKVLLQTAFDLYKPKVSISNANICALCVLSKLKLKSFTRSTTMCNESSCFSMSKEQNMIIDLISHYLPTIWKVPSLCHE